MLNLRDIVRKITGLGTGGRTKLKTIFKNVFMKSMSITKLGAIGKVLEWGGIDFISFAIDVILNITNPLRILANVIAEAVYKFVKKATAAI